MGRLIDVCKAIDAINEECDNLEKMRGGIVYAQGLRGAIPILDTIPTAEPETIRCRDCKFYTPMNRETKTGICNLTLHQNFGDDWFCAGAERRYDETD